MSQITSILPLIDKSSWRWNVQSEINTEIGAGSSDRLYDAESVGWFYWGLITVRGSGGPDSEINIDSGRLKVDSTIAEFYESGVTGRGAGAPSINRYDTTNDIYGVLYEPRPPIYFNEGFTINVESPSDKSIAVNSDMLELEVIDQDKFISSLRSVLIPNVDIENKLDTISQQLQRTNNLLSTQIGQLSEDGLQEITQGERTEDTSPPIDAIDSVTEELEDSGQPNTRDEDLSTLGK